MKLETKPEAASLLLTMLTVCACILLSLSLVLITVNIYSVFTKGILGTSYGGKCVDLIENLA